MKKLASKQGSQLVLKDDGKYTFKMSEKEWMKIGKEAGWFDKKPQSQAPAYDPSDKRLQFGHGDRVRQSLQGPQKPISDHLYEPGAKLEGLMRQQQQLQQQMQQLQQQIEQQKIADQQRAQQEQQQPQQQIMQQENSFG